MLGVWVPEMHAVGWHNLGPSLGQFGSAELQQNGFELAVLSFDLELK